jgi:hypothetical protein
VSAPSACSPLLDPALVAFLHGGLAGTMATASTDGLPALTRAYALRVAPDARTVDVFVGRDQSTTCLANMTPGRLLAVTTGSPLDYRGVQIKGTVITCQAPDAEDALWLERALKLFEAAVARVGVTSPRGFRCQEYVRVTFSPTAIFRQTPGPGAGNPLDAGPP